MSKSTIPHPHIQTLALESPWGWWNLESTETHVLSFDFLRATVPADARTEPETKLEKRLDCMLSRYFRGEVIDFSQIPVDLTQVTPFRREVLTLLRTVPYGEVRHYQWLAETLNKPNASRAVGGALGSNPWPILVPCHRIISKTGALGGFMRGSSASVWLKAELLTMEGADFPGKKPPSSLLKAEAL